MDTRNKLAPRSKTKLMESWLRNFAGVFERACYIIAARNAAQRTHTSNRLQSRIGASSIGPNATIPSPSPIKVDGVVDFC